LTALRLLSQPGLVERDDIGVSAAFRQRIKKLQKDFKDRWPTEVDVVVFNDRASANPFIRLRHTGENAGAGRSAWSALQIARFDETGVWRCLEQLREDSALNLEVLNQLERSEFPITNFERVASTADFQERFGISLGKGTFSITGEKQRAYSALSKLASDVATGRVDSRGEFAEAKGMKKYFDEVEAALKKPSSHEDSNPQQASTDPESTADGQQQQQSPDQSSGANEANATNGTDTSSTSTQSASSSSGTTSSSAGTVRKKRISKYLIDKKDLTTVTNPKCRAIVDELKFEVPVGDAPYACALLLRSLQEMTAQLYLEAYGLKPGNNKTTNIAQAAAHLLGHKHSTDPANYMDLAKNFNASSASYDEFCQTAHSALSAVSSDHVRSTWKNLGGGMDLLWKRIHAIQKSSDAMQK
jgi:hypothetical protein